MNALSSLIAGILLAAILPARADNPLATFDSVKTTGGKEYTAVEVTSVADDSIRVRHSAGLATIPVAELPVAVKRRLGIRGDGKPKNPPKEPEPAAPAERASLNLQELAFSSREKVVLELGEPDRVIPAGGDQSAGGELLEYDVDGGEVAVKIVRDECALVSVTCDGGPSTLDRCLKILSLDSWERSAPSKAGRTRLDVQLRKAKRWWTARITGKEEAITHLELIPVH